MENRIMSAVKAIICCHGRILLVRRSLNASVGAGEWEFPCGEIIFGETPENALKREVVESTSLNVRIREIGYVSSYMRREDEQLIFIAYICTANRDIVELNTKYGDYMWVRPEKLYENISENIKEEVLKHYGKINDFVVREYV